MHRAVLCTSFEPGGLAVGQVETPDPAPGQALVAVAAAGVNFADTLMVQGRYQERPPFPFTPGLEAAGTVIATGAGVSQVAVGDRVLAIPGQGAQTERLAMPAAELLRLPEGMGFPTAAGFAVTYGTAHGALEWRARLQPGETLLVLGAAGGVGLAAVEVGKAMGATVIAAASSPDKLGIARAHGADHLIDYSREDLRTRLKDLTGGAGVDVVFDPVGGDLFEVALRGLAWEGRIVVIGFAAGKIPAAPANLLLVKNVGVLGLYWGAYRKKNPQAVADSFARLFGWWGEGRLKPRVSANLDLAQVAEAYDLLTSRRATGKVVLTTGAS